jgi:hypothetical protein
MARRFGVGTRIGVAACVLVLLAVATVSAGSGRHAPRSRRACDAAPARGLHGARASGVDPRAPTFRSAPAGPAPLGAAGPPPLGAPGPPPLGAGGPAPLAFPESVGVRPAPHAGMDGAIEPAPFDDDGGAAAWEDEPDDESWDGEPSAWDAEPPAE